MTNISTITTIKSDITAIDTKVNTLINDILEYHSGKKEEFKTVLIEEGLNTLEDNNVSNKNLLNIYFNHFFKVLSEDITKGRVKRINKAVFSDLETIGRNIDLIIDLNLNGGSNVDKLELIKSIDKIFNTDKHGSLKYPLIIKEDKADGGAIYKNENKSLISKNELKKLSVQKNDANDYTFSTRLLNLYLKELINDNKENFATYSELQRLNK